MKILVARHGLTEEPSLRDDGKRSLSEKGREQLKSLCRLPDLVNSSFDLLLHSPLLRAEQSADIFCDLLTVNRRESSRLLLPEAAAEPLFEAIGLMRRERTARSLMLMGHQPFLSGFVSAALTGGERNFVSLERGGLAFLHFPGGAPVPGTGFLTALLNPRLPPG